MFESFGNQNTSNVALEKEPTPSEATGDTWQEEAVANFERSQQRNSESNTNKPKIEQRELIQKRFTDELFDSSADSNYVKSIFAVLNEYGFTQNEFENVFNNASKNQSLREEIRKGGPAVEHLLYELGNRVIDNSDIVTALITNNNERQRVIQKNQQELSKRIANNPIATDEEYRLGAYTESLEPQVSDAVFKLLEKGYSPFESGFLDLSAGSQYIGFEKIPNIAPEQIVEAINKNFNENNKKVFSEIRIENQDDRIQIILIPKIRTMSLGAWRLFWNDIADCLPEVHNESSNNKKIDNGNQGEIFRKNQDKLRQLQ